MSAVLALAALSDWAATPIERARTATLALRFAAPRPLACQEPAVIECPRGCGFVTAAKPSLRWGPWRMHVHLANPTCPRPIPGSSQATYAGGGYRPRFTR